MKKLSSCCVGALGAIALLAGAALPASAADTATTDTTFNLFSGTLDVGTQKSAQLRDNIAGTTSVRGSLGDVSVTDSRGTRAGWEVTVISSQFTSDSGTTSENVSYNTGEVTTSGTVSTKSTGDTDVVAPATVLFGVNVSGNNTATWDPTLTVTLPADSLAGTYQATVTTSVA